MSAARYGLVLAPRRNRIWIQPSNHERMLSRKGALHSRALDVLDACGSDRLLSGANRPWVEVVHEPGAVSPWGVVPQRLM